MNDSIIIGSVLVLVFGALFYYLYSRLLYSEKRVNVMENILLDLKTASETYFTSDATAPVEEQYQHEQQQQQQQQQPTSGTSLTEQDIHPSPAEAEVAPVASVASASVGRNYEAMNIKELQAELRNRNPHVSGVSGMRRKELIEHLRKTDTDGVVGSTSAETIGSSTTTSLVDLAGPVDA